MACDTVRIEQLHYVHKDTEKGQKGEPEADPQLKPILAMNRRGFKWKSLGNDNGKRYQIMQMARPKDIDAANKKNKIRQEPFILKSGHLYALDSNSSFK